MPKKPGKIGGGDKVSGVKGTSQTSGVEATERVSDVSKVKKASGVGGVKGSGAIGKRRPTRMMSLAERTELFNMIHDEADKLLKNSGFSDEQKEVIETAVKMAVDTGLVEDDGEE